LRPGDNVKSAPKALKEPYSERALREIAAASAAAASTTASPSPSPSQSAPIASSAKPEAKPESAAPPTTGDNGDDDRLDWAWPAKGKLIGAFSETANLKGIDIAGTAGEPVVASAPGKVVYAGTGLRGYGKLIIIKHNSIYLSAYAHNREILVKEGQQVTRGQKIAEMGNSDTDQVKLHFEIRRLGKPMDPVRYLPPA
jgi:lipoprotein NlpD